MKYKGFVLAVVLLSILAVGYARVGTKVKLPGPIKRTVLKQGGAKIEVPEPSTFPVTVEDASGGSVQLTAAPRRIVSLAPGATELLFDLGAGDRMAADTTACDWPPAAARLPHVGGAFDMSLESVAARNPDLIVADRTINQRIILTLKAAHLPVLVIEPKNLDTSYETIRLLGRVTGRTSDAADMINGMRREFAAIGKIVGAASARRRVLVMYDTGPIYTSGPGTLISDMINVAGGVNIAKSNDPIDPESVIQAQPDVIICTPELEKKIESLPAWKGTVPAVTNTAYFQCSNMASLIRAGKRLAVGAAELARYLHPELFTSDGKPAPIVGAHPAAGAR